MRIRTYVLIGLTALPLGLSVPSFAEPTPPRRVVGQSLSNRQAVLLDEESGEYRVVRLGDELNGARVIAIGDEDVVLVRGGTQEMLKLAPDPRPRAKVMMEPLVINIRPMSAPAVAPVAVAPVAVAPVAVAPVAAPPVIAAPMIAPPPPSQPSVAVAVAPPVPAAPIVVTPPPPGSPPVVMQVPRSSTVVVQQPEPAPIAVAAVPSVVIPPPTTPTLVNPPVAAPAPIAAPVAVPAAPPPPTPPLVAPAPVAVVPTPAPVFAPPAAPTPVTNIPRADLERGLGDFQTLDASVAIEVAPQGGFRVAELKDGSFLQRMGLRRGDTILRVDGRSLRTAEDASAAYNWVRVADHFVVDLVRDGQPITLRFRVA